jgi:hypothetical protein
MVRYTPVHVSALSDVKAISAGFFHSMALKSDGTVWAWGMNSFGQLGDDTTSDRSTPVQTLGPDGSGFLNFGTASGGGGGGGCSLNPEGVIGLEWLLLVFLFPMMFLRRRVR